jgi:hypothetical protein
MEALSYGLDLDDYTHTEARRTGTLHDISKSITKLTTIVEKRRGDELP